MYNNARISPLLGRESVYRINRALASVRPRELHYGESETRTHTPSYPWCFFIPGEDLGNKLDSWLFCRRMYTCMQALPLSQHFDSATESSPTFITVLHGYSWFAFTAAPHSWMIIEFFQSRPWFVCTDQICIRCCSCWCNSILFRNTILFLVQSYILLFLESHTRCAWEITL